jgi:hypothetical protein
MLEVNSKLQIKICNVQISHVNSKGPRDVGGWKTAMYAWKQFHEQVMRAFYSNIQ